MIGQVGGLAASFPLQNRVRQFPVTRLKHLTKQPLLGGPSVLPPAPPARPCTVWPIMPASTWFPYDSVFTPRMGEKIVKDRGYQLLDT